MPKEPPTFFISYARQDWTFVLKLVKKLREAGASLWLDQLDILPGQPWDEVVEGALKACRGVLVVLSPDSVISQNALNEVSYALEEGKHVVPLLYRECEIPFRMRRLHRADFTVDYDLGFSQLLKALPSESFSADEGPTQSWDTIKEKYAINSIVTGKVHKLADFGAFVKIEEGVEGFVHVSDLSWTKKIKHPSEILTKGQEVSVLVLNVDSENRRISLGIKQLELSPLEYYFSQKQLGHVVRGRIVRFASFGAFVQLSEGVEGLCPISELDEKGIENPEDHFEIGQEMDFKIIKMNLLDRRITLSLKALKEGASKPLAPLESEGRRPPPPQPLWPSSTRLMPRAKGGTQVGINDGHDDLYDEAARFVVETGKASTMLLQRRLRIGNSRAMKLLDMMERRGLIGPTDSNKHREVLVPSNYFHDIE